jgi:hypothetical protein
MRRAMTVVDRGMMVVSSSYTATLLVRETLLPVLGIHATHTLFHALIGADDQVEIGSIAESAPQNDLTFQLKDRDASSVELHASGLFLGLELEENRGSHVD